MSTRGVFSLLKRGGIGLLALAGLLLGLRAIAPIYIEHLINSHIAHSDKIAGRIEDVDLHLWRGAYSIQGINIYTVARDLQRPLLKMPNLELTLEWASLVRGQLRSELIFHRPVINLHDSKEENIADENALDEDTTWIALADRVAPFAINSLHIHNGQLQLFLDSDNWRKGLALTGLRGELRNITNSLQIAESLDGTFNVTGQLYGESTFTLAGSYAPYAKAPTFNVDFTMAALPAPHLDPLVGFYTPYDVEAGSLDLAAEMQADEGAVEGYMRLGLKDISVFNWRNDVTRDGDPVFSVVFEGLTDGLAELLENHQTGAIATKIPLQGDLSNIDTPLFIALWGIVENAFIRAYQVELEDSLADRAAGQCKTQIPKPCYPS